jgi:hypothetical protein
MKKCNSKKKNEQEYVQRDDERFPFPCDISPGDFINKYAAIRNDEEEKPFFYR